MIYMKCMLEQSSDDSGALVLGSLTDGDRLALRLSGSLHDWARLESTGSFWGAGHGHSEPSPPLGRHNHGRTLHKHTIYVTNNIINIGCIDSATNFWFCRPRPPLGALRGGAGRRGCQGVPGRPVPHRGRLGGALHCALHTAPYPCQLEILVTCK